MVSVRTALLLFLGAVTALPDDASDWMEMNRRATQLQRSGRLNEAIAMFQQALTVAERASPPDVRVAVAWNNFGLVHHESGHPAEAERAYLRSLKLSEQYLGSNSREYSAAIANLATLYVETGQIAKAEPLQQRLAAALANSEPSPAQTIRLYSIQGSIYQGRGRRAEAEERYRAAMALAETKPEFAYEVASALNNLAVLAFEQHKYDRAKELIQRSIAVTEAQDGVLSPRLISPFVNLATLAFRDKQYESAAAMLRRVISIMESTGPQDSSFLREAYERYSVALRSAGRKSEAKEATEHARRLPQDGVLTLRDRYTIDVWSLRGKH